MTLPLFWLLKPTCGVTWQRSFGPTLESANSRTPPTLLTSDSDTHCAIREKLLFRHQRAQYILQFYVLPRSWRITPTTSRTYDLPGRLNGSEILPGICVSKHTRRAVRHGLRYTQIQYPLNFIIETFRTPKPEDHLVFPPVSCWNRQVPPRQGGSPWRGTCSTRRKTRGKSRRKEGQWWQRPRGAGHGGTKVSNEAGSHFIVLYSNFL